MTFLAIQGDPEYDFNHNTLLDEILSSFKKQQRYVDSLHWGLRIGK
jgi:hypothetical protein